MYAASPTKLLFLHEKLGADEVAPIGDYLFLAWNAIAALIMDISWRTYFRYMVQKGKGEGGRKVSATQTELD